jgi:hypothetical protein
MNEQRRLGVIVMVAAIFITLLILVISDGWESRVDLLTKLMVGLYVCFIPDGGDYYSPYYLSCSVGVPTKYLLLGSVGLFLVGFLNYRSYINISSFIAKFKTEDTKAP